jgi:micrococcal nuclease
MKKHRLRFLVLLSLCTSQQTLAAPYELIQVYDGDTVKLRDADGEFKLRITDIDAPERNQAYGKKSRRALAQLCKGRDILVTAQLTGMDKYQRYLGRLQCNQIDASIYLTERGLAWHNSKYSSDVSIYQAQQQAQFNKIGLWQEPNPIPPWVWRQQHQNHWH